MGINRYLWDIRNDHPNYETPCEERSNSVIILHDQSEKHENYTVNRNAYGDAYLRHPHTVIFPEDISKRSGLRRGEGQKQVVTLVRGISWPMVGRCRQAAASGAMTSLAPKSPKKGIQYHVINFPFHDMASVT